MSEIDWKARAEAAEQTMVDMQYRLEAAERKCDMHHSYAVQFKSERDDARKALDTATGAVREFSDDLHADRRERDDMRKMLERLEWAGRSAGLRIPFCLACYKYQALDHAPDCELDRLLRPR